MQTKEVLYILMRSDLDSLNPGKAMAQACHGANQAHTRYVDGNMSNCNSDAYERWLLQADGFGTTLVLDGGTENNIKKILDSKFLKGNSYFETGLIIDPSYPLRDGIITHVIPNLVTCAWLFCADGRITNKALVDLKLHK